MSELNVAEMMFDYQKILNNPSFLDSTRLLAAKMIKNPYITLRKYFESLPDNDLKVLVDKIEEEDLEEVLLLGEMLAAGEGSKSENIEEVTEHTNMLAGMIVCVSLARKGLVEVLYDNMTFDPQYADRPIVRRV